MITSATATPCPLCEVSHGEILEHFVAGEVRRISDGDLAAEIVYVQRERADDPGDRETALQHRLNVLQAEAQRRRRITAKGGPLYRGRTSIPHDKIVAIKRDVHVADLIGCDLSVAWVRGNRTYFHCDIHGDGRDLHPSLVAFEDEGRYHCFGCNAGGDQIDWMIARHNMTFREAVEALG